MQEAILYGLMAVAPLVLVPILGIWLKLRPHTVAVLQGFGAGAFIAALAFSLFAESIQHGGNVVAGVGLLSGAAAYIILGQVLTHRYRKSAVGIQPLVAGFIDGVPESLTLGTAIALSGQPGALLAAIIISNIPEAFASAEKLRQAKRSERFIVGSWSFLALLLFLSVLLGFALGEIPEYAIAPIEAFAAGAVIGLVVDTMLPDAYRHGGPWVAFATAAGFLAAFLISQMA